MRTIEKFLSDLTDLDIKLWVENVNGAPQGEVRLRCKAPKGTLTSDIRAQLSERKAEIIAFLQQTSLDSNSTFGVISRVYRDNIEVPLSSAQARLWLLDQLQGQSATYNMPAAVQIAGSLNVYAFEQALKEIVRRHEVLRTHFNQINGTPVQVIDPEAGVALPIIDLQGLSEVEQSTQVQHLCTLEAQKPFDLSQSPLLRVTLLRLHQNYHVLMLVMHHIVSDAWSIGIFIQELSTLYVALASGKPNPLPELPIQYADFAVWQQKLLREQVLETQLNYWKQQLAGAPPLLELPTTKRRPASQTFCGSSWELKLSLDLTEKINAISRKSGVTLFMTLLTAFVTLLARYSGQDDILIGTPIANRNRLEIETLIGFFVNTLVLRTQIQGNPSFEELLKQVQQVTLSAYEHQDVPFEQVVEACGPQRNLNYSPLFQVMFFLQNAPMGKLELPGLTITLNEINTGTSKFDLTLLMEETPQGLVGTWEYNTDLFDQETIARMAGHFQTLLEAIVAHPQQEVWKLPLLSDAEEHQLLVRWNQTKTDYPDDQCIHQLFESQVQSTPDAVAVVFEHQQITYWELNARANQLAHYLQLHGVRQHALVGICMERSVDLLIAILAILKAGGAYVPLDPSYPRERLALMLSDAQVQVLLTQQHLNEGLPEHGAQVVCLDTDWNAICGLSQDNPKSGVFATDCSYVIYTSGSTGLPKGVRIRHRGVVRLVKQTNYVRLSLDETFLQLAAFSFDAATFEIWGCLLNGGRLVVMSGNRPSLMELGQTIRQYQVTTLWLTAGLFHQMVDQRIEDLKSVRQLLAGGDVLSVAMVEKVLRQLKNCQLINGYGPTENTTFTCCYSVTQLASLGNSVPIGRPIANTEVYILDGDLQPVPVGVAGELYIGGDGLAEGYLNRPELTAQKFIPNPFDRQPGARLYKTGDLGRYLASGDIEFLVRLDTQVKIRGFRIELGEIEAVLAQHPDVRSTFAIAREDVPGDKRLVAYFVSHDLGAATINDLRSFLKQKLPEYMVPAAFVKLDTLPLTPNGKVDRRALRAPDWEHSDSVSFVLPHTDTQQVIAEIFAEVLHIFQVGIHDNYFELGGHSLNATQVVSRLRERFNIELPLRCLFEFPTVAQLDEYICTLRQPWLGLVLPAIKPVPRDTQNLPLSWAQTRLWFLEQLQGGTATYNIPAAVQITGALNINALEQSLREIVRRHEILRTSYHTVNGQPVQVISDDATVTLPVVDLQQLPEVEQLTVVRSLATLEAQQPFKLSKSPLLRVTLLRLHPHSHVLLLCMHHIISDGWSMGIFIQELSTVYTALASGKPNPLPELPIQYADFAVWQQQWLREQVLETQLNYWKQQLAGAPPLLKLPTDRPRPASQTFRGSSWSISLSQDLTQKLDAISRKSGVTLFMTLLAAFATLLWRYTRQDDILIGTPIANRNRLEVEPLIGFFVNTLVLRTQIQAELSFEKLLKQVQQMTLSAYEHQDVPFEQVVEACGPERSLNHSPLFQVMFALQNAPIGKLELPCLVLTPLEMETATSKFDLSLLMAESPQGLVGTWEYNADLFDRQTIAQITEHFQTLLEAIVAHPQQEVWKFPLLCEQEQHQLLVRWNDTQIHYPDDKCIHQLFEEQVQRTPDAIALVFEDQQLTYWELNACANQLAHYLQSLGVGPEALVGICVERSVSMVVGLLGILKAGGAYVPLDSTYPAERLQYMLDDAQVSVLLVQSHLRNIAPHQMQVVCLDTDWGVISDRSQENINSVANASNLAYVIYTSGSTGKPKGAMNTHQGICNRLLWMQDAYQLIESDSVLQKTPFSFDVSVWEFFWSLMSGARLVMAQPGGHKDSRYLVDLIAQQKITTAHFVPSMLEVFLEETNLERCNCLQRVICSGEAVTLELQKRFFARLRCQLHNLYGPTEAAIDVTSWQCQQNSDSQIVAIGCPIANTQIYILDSHLQPVPVGVPGELYIGGVGVARGYLNRPELTVEKFIPNPFSNQLGARLYKTGDLGRYLPDGNIQFLGRIDYQVKIRGFRIELGEIEAVLTTHPEVRQAVVIPKEDTKGDKRLVAYVMSQESLTTSELRNLLKQKLPDYMVPSSFVFLEALPLTPNGKVDRQVLPTPEKVSDSTSFVPPRDELELQLAQIWSEILEVDKVGTQDNFFDLGGHSLLAVRLMAQIHQQFGKNLSLATLFQSPTIEQLATFLRKHSDFSVWSPLVAIQPNGSKRPFFCVPGAGGNIIYFHKLASYLGSDQPFYGLQALGLDGESEPHTQVQDMASYYIEAIQTVQPQGPYFLGGHSLGGKVAFEMATQLLDQGHEVALLAIMDTTAPLPEINHPMGVDWDNAKWLTEIAKIVGHMFGKEIKISYDTLVSLKPEEQLEYLKQQLEVVPVLPTGAGLAQLRSLLEVFKVGYQVNYAPHKVYPNRITLFRSTEVVSHEFVNETVLKIAQDSTWGWSNLTAESVDVHFVPGDHHTMMTEPHVRVLAELLLASIEHTHR